MTSSKNPGNLLSTFWVRISMAWPMRSSNPSKEMVKPWVEKHSKLVQLGCPLLDNAIAFVECSLVDSIEKGDHSLFVGEVLEAGVSNEPGGRADDETLWLRDLGEKTFYGG